MAVGPPPGAPLAPRDGRIALGVPAIVELVLDAKAIMTEYGKARRNRLRNLQAFHNYAHSYNEKTIAVGTAAVNVSRVCWSPTRSTDDITEHVNIEALGPSTVELFRGLPLRHDPTEGAGLEATSVMVVDFDNLAKHPTPPRGAPLPENQSSSTGRQPRRSVIPCTVPP